MKNAPSIQFYPRDYLADADVRMLNFAQRGIYMDLLCFCWERDGLPKDHQLLARLLNLSQKEAAGLLPDVMRLFSETESGYHHGRLLEQKELYAERRAKARANIAKRWSDRNTEESDSSNTTVLPSYYETDTRGRTPVAVAEAVEEAIAVEEKLSDIPSSGEKSPRKPKADEPDGFAEFYDAYPKHVGRTTAAKCWRKLAPDTDLRRRIGEHVAAMAQTWDWQKDGGQFVPHPATYLNQQRWTDELPKGNGAVAMRASQQSALPLNAPSSVEPPAPTSTLPPGLTKSAGDLAWWAECLGKIADGMDPDFFREYIGCLEIAGIAGEWLHLEAPTAYIKGNAVWHCDAIEEATGKQVKIHVRDWSQDE